MLDSRDVGHRVVVRRIVGASHGRPLFADLLGVLLEFTDGSLTVRTSTGPVRVPLGEVHRAKRIPDRRRPGGRQIRELEWAADEAWPAPVVAHLGQWRLRAADGWTGRANSALAVGDPGLPIDAAIDEVVRWYAARGQHPLVNVPLPYAARIDAALAARGWPHRPKTLVLTVDLPDLVKAARPDAGLPAVTLAAAPTPAWLAMVAGEKGEPPPAARHVLTAVPGLRFAHLYSGDDLVAVARGAVTSGWFGLSLLAVRRDQRRRGLARHVVAALAGWAAETGAERGYLQVEERNTAAVALYASLGYTLHHHYLTRYAPPDEGAPTDAANPAAGTC